MHPGVDDGAAPVAEVSTAIRFSLDAGDAAVGAASAAEVVTDSGGDSGSNQLGC